MFLAVSFHLLLCCRNLFIIFFLLRIIVVVGYLRLWLCLIVTFALNHALNHFGLGLVFRASKMRK